MKLKPSLGSSDTDEYHQSVVWSGFQELFYSMMYFTCYRVPKACYFFLSCSHNIIICADQNKRYYFISCSEKVNDYLVYLEHTFAQICTGDCLVWTKYQIFLAKVGSKLLSCANKRSDNILRKQVNRDTHEFAHGTTVSCANKVLDDSVFSTR